LQRPVAPKLWAKSGPDTAPADRHGEPEIPRDGFLALRGRLIEEDPAAAEAAFTTLVAIMEYHAERRPEVPHAAA